MHCSLVVSSASLRSLRLCVGKIFARTETFLTQRRSSQQRVATRKGNYEIPKFKMVWWPG